MEGYRRQQGFSLIELLSALAVVGLLVAILVPSVGSIGQKSRAAGGAAVMRDIGHGIKLHAIEHGGHLPGPLWPGQIPVYDPERSGRLVRELAPYMGIAERDEAYLVDAFVPPAYPLEALGVELPRVFVVNTAVTQAGRLIQPWGSLLGDEPVNPARFTQLHEPGAVWAVSDADRQHPEVAGAPWAANTPETPIHGGFRHVLYFDGRVEAVPVDRTGVFER